MKAMHGLYVWMLGLAWACAGCGLFGCPEDEKVGDVALTGATQALIPYEGTPVLRFANENGEAITLTGESPTINPSQLCQRVICTEARIKGETSCEYVEAEAAGFLFRGGDSVLLDVLYYVELAAPESQSYLDLMRLSLGYGEGANAETLLMAERLEPGVTVDTAQQQSLQNIGTLTLGGQVFNEVYTNAAAPLFQLYYTHAQGLVAFEAEGKLWVLQP